MKCSDESNNRRSFVACDVSTGRNECWLRGGVHVSPSPSTGKEPRHRGTLERAFVLVDSPPLALSCHPLIMSGSSLAFSHSPSTLMGLMGRGDAFRSAPVETKVSHSPPPFSPRRAMPYPHPQSPPPTLQDPQSGDRR